MPILKNISAWILVCPLSVLWGFSSVGAVEPDGQAPLQVQANIGEEDVIARPGYHYAFPKDHGAHYEYRIEWWYFTGHLFTESGRRFGYELTFFRRKVDENEARQPSAWAIDHLYIGHLALTDEQNGRFHFSEKLSRPALGKAGAAEGSLNVWIDRWSCRALNADHSMIHLKGENSTFSIDLRLTLQKPPVIHGKEGVSVKGPLPEQASHYYSLTRLSTHGLVFIDGEALSVTGLSWMDHEFGSGAMGPDLVGWDWFSVQLESDVEIMLYVLRRENLSIDPVSSGTVVFPDGTTHHLEWNAVRVKTVGQWVSPVTQARYPARWQIVIPFMDLMLDVIPIQPDQELVTSRSTQIAYWEGAVDVRGARKGVPINGAGYVELTGYDRPLKKTY